MLDDYPAQIKAAYDKMYKEGPISPYLKKSTPSNLRKHSLNLYRTKNTLRDKGIICDFLEINLRVDDLESIIRDAPLKKFKTVQNFFKSKTEDPRDYTIEFIAWLIDFEQHKAKPEIDLEILDDQTPPVGPSTIIMPIPFESKAQTDERGNELSELERRKEDKKGEEVLNEQSSEETPKSENTIIDKGQGGISTGHGGIAVVPETTTPIIVDPSIPSFTAKIVLAIILIAESLIAYFGFYYDKPIVQAPSEGKKCMYWTGSYYEASVCNLPINPSQKLIPFNLTEWQNLRKITRRDTLTEKDIGKVFYFKENNDLEMFTSKGRYPLDTSRVLKPLTEYMYNAHFGRIKELASLKQQVTAGGIGSVMVASIGLWWLSVVQVRRRKRKRRTLSAG